MNDNRNAIVVSRTPFRISFFGGGTDLPAWYRENGGAVLSTTIDKYCYIYCGRAAGSFVHKHRIVYSKIEHVQGLEDIAHPTVRETFRFMDVKEGLEIHHGGDLPAQTGLGSSSAFTVGLLHALHVLRGTFVAQRTLALQAIHIEQEMVRESVGSQDQVAVALGGLNIISFSGNHTIEIHPVDVDTSKREAFREHLMLFFTGFARYASQIEADKIQRLPTKKNELMTMLSMVTEAVKMVKDGDFVSCGKLLHEHWQCKKSLSDRVSNKDIEHIYSVAMKNGAIGGKILGAGGGGFILFFVKPEDRERVKTALNFLRYVPFQFDTAGSRIIYCNEGGIRH
jgi:D-glycero-alpha-D-manno-heptose-7-phosphate kinase